MQSPAKLKSKSTKNHTPTTTTITTTTAQRTQRAQQAPYNAGDTVFFGLEKRRTAERIHAIQLQRDSKTVLISELKAFGRNFKLSTPVPEDLVCITFAYVFRCLAAGDEMRGCANEVVDADFGKGWEEAGTGGGEECEECEEFEGDDGGR